MESQGSQPFLTSLPTSDPTTGTVEPLYAGHTRFELELEFVTLLSSPQYLSHLASTTHLLSQPSFIAYLRYLLYWTKPPYVYYLSYPGPTLKALELLQRETFREEVIRPEVVANLAEAWTRAGLDHVR